MHGFTKGTARMNSPLISMANTPIDPIPFELIQLRRACDRCHSQKLRCKRTGAGNCDRCEKTGVTCVFSPSRRMRKMSQPKDGDARLSVSGASSHIGLNDNMSLDDLLHWDLATTEWASQGADPVGYDFENSLSSVDPGVVAAPGTMNFHVLNPDELYMNSGSSLSDQSISDHSAPDHAAPPVTEAGHLSSHEQWIRKISDLNIKLYQHAAIFPPAASGIRRASQHPSALEGDGTTDQNRTIAIDRTFNFTTEVLEALELVSSPSPGNGLRNGIEPLDQGSLLLILSLYLRLLDLYYAIFEPLQKLLPSPRYRPSSSSSHYPPSFVSTDSPSPFPERTLDGRLPRFPVLRIGEFSLQTSPSVHTLMTIQLAEQLLGLVNRAVQTITRNQSAANTPFRYEKQEYFMGEEHGLDRLRDSSGMDVAELSLKAVEKRHMEVMAVVKAIKWALTSR